MKYRSSKRSVACAISDKVRRAVEVRDSIDGWPCCIICGSPQARPEAHYISRAHGGLGIEQNIFTACRRCHNKYDNSTDWEEREAIKEIIIENFKKHYPDWDEEQLRYNKYAGIED